VGPGADLALPVVESAADQDDIQRIRFLYDPAPIVKIEETRKMKFLSSADRSAESRRLREMLLVRNPSAIACQSVIVYDDVFTTGSTLDAVAGVLRRHGATRVRG
jgi:predicted amidophosphoribosyltransferase